MITTPTLLLHGIASCWTDGRGEIVPNDEPPTEPRGVVKNGVELAVSSSLSDNRLSKQFTLHLLTKIHIQIQLNRSKNIYLAWSFCGGPNNAFLILSGVLDARRLLLGLSNCNLKK